MEHLERWINILSPIWVSLVAGFIGYFVDKRNAIRSEKNGDRINEIHLSINIRMDELLKQKGIASHAEGLAEGCQLFEQNAKERESLARIEGKLEGISPSAGQAIHHQ